MGAAGIQDVITTAAGTVPGGIDLIISGVISDGGAGYGFTKAGPGVLDLTGANTYTGTNIVSAGTLLVDGSIAASLVTVSGSMGGSGTIANTVNVQNGGSHPGRQCQLAGTLTVNTLNLGINSTDITQSRFTVAAGGEVGAQTINLNGTNIVQILDPSLTVGTYTLFTYVNVPAFPYVGGGSGAPGTSNWARCQPA